MIQLQVASGTGQVESSYSTATARLAQLRVRVPAPAASPDSEPAKPDSPAETQAQNAPGPYVYCHQQYEPPAGHAAYRHAARAENLMIHLIQI